MRAYPSRLDPTAQISADPPPDSANSVWWIPSADTRADVRLISSTARASAGARTSRCQEGCADTCADVSADTLELTRPPPGEISSKSTKFYVKSKSHSQSLNNPVPGLNQPTLPHPSFFHERLQHNALHEHNPACVMEKWALSRAMRIRFQSTRCVLCTKANVYAGRAGTGLQAVDVLLH